MALIQVDGMSRTERDFLRMAAVSAVLWKTIITFGILLMLVGAGFILARLMDPELDFGSGSSMMVVAGLFMVLYANLLRGAREFLRRNGLLDHALALKRGPAT